MIVAEPLRFYIYVIVDVRQQPSQPVHLVFTRAEGRDMIERLNAEGIKTDHLRIRRGKVTLFER